MDWWEILLIVLAALFGYWLYTVGMYAYFGKKLSDKYRR